MEMNLFRDETKDFLRTYIHDEGWVEKLSSCINQDKMTKLITKLVVMYNEKKIYPEFNDIFKIFRLCPFDKVKVVIVGQDPYHNGNADGIAFSCKEKLSPSLAEIKRAISRTESGLDSPNLQDVIPNNLEYLVEQGVFLYNPILTVEEGKPLSHKGIGWEGFSDCVFKALGTKKDLIWMLWGNEAQTRALSFVSPNQVSLKCVHPASAARNNTIWNCKDFSIVNGILKDRNVEPIKWI